MKSHKKKERRRELENFSFRKFRKPKKAIEIVRVGIANKRISLKVVLFRRCKGANDTLVRKIFRALLIILAIFLSFDYQFLSFHACYKQCKA